MSPNRKKKKNPAHSLRCPYCGKPAKLIPATGILPAHAKVTQLYTCADYPKCDTYVCVHPGTNLPMGTLADSGLRQLRQSAHYYFDKLHTSGLMRKADAYAWLADKAWLPRNKAHIGHFNEYNCRLIIGESKRLIDERRDIERRRDDANESRAARVG